MSEAPPMPVLDVLRSDLLSTCPGIVHGFTGRVPGLGRADGNVARAADLLIREPESVTAPLSVMLNPYRPLPLAGVVFSQPSAGAERAVAHHWGMDKRWDILPESVRMLPAGLRPRKPGVPWRKVFASVVALSMVGCAAWMSIACTCSACSRTMRCTSSVWSPVMRAS